jgi:hypothetical protein
MRINWRATLRYKVLLAILVLSLVVSIGVNGYFYILLVGRQAWINNFLSRTIATWAREMDIAGYLLQNATTNVAVAGVNCLFRTARETADTAWVYDSQTVYLYMALAAGDIEESLYTYCVGAPTDLKYINQTAIEMFAILHAKIQNAASNLLDISELDDPRGTDPMHLLKERGLINSIIDNCTDVRNYSTEIHDFSSKFQ